MSRQILPNLFDDKPQANTTEQVYEPLPLLDQANPIQKMTEQVGEKFNQFRFETQKIVKSVALRLEKNLQRIQQLEEKVNHLVAESKERFSQIGTKVKDNQRNEMRMESLVERHQQVVQSFELKLAKAQRLIDNQSLQLAKQTEMIAESRREIEKLKRL